MPAGPTRIHAHVQSHLIVAAAASVQALAGLADAVGQKSFHKHVHILRAHVDGQRTGVVVVQNPPQPFHDALSVLARDDALLAQHGGMGDGAGHVAFQQALVKGNRGLKIVQKGAGGFLKAPGP